MQQTSVSLTEEESQWIDSMRGVQSRSSFVRGLVATAMRRGRFGGLEIPMVESGPMDSLTVAVADDLWDSMRANNGGSYPVYVGGQVFAATLPASFVDRPFDASKYANDLLRSGGEPMGDSSAARIICPCGWSETATPANPAEWDALYRKYDAHDCRLVRRVDAGHTHQGFAVPAPATPSSAWGGRGAPKKGDNMTTVFGRPLNGKFTLTYLAADGEEFSVTEVGDGENIFVENDSILDVKWDKWP